MAVRVRFPLISYPCIYPHTTASLSQPTADCGRREDASFFWSPPSPANSSCDLLGLADFGLSVLVRTGTLVQDRGFCFSLSLDFSFSFAAKYARRFSRSLNALLDGAPDPPPPSAADPSVAAATSAASTIDSSTSGDTPFPFLLSAAALSFFASRSSCFLILSVMLILLASLFRFFSSISKRLSSPTLRRGIGPSIFRASSLAFESFPDSFNDAAAADFFFFFFFVFDLETVSAAGLSLSSRISFSIALIRSFVWSHSFWKASSSF